MMANAAAASLLRSARLARSCETPVTVCRPGNTPWAAGLLVASGRCDVGWRGAAEAPITPIALAGFRNMTAMSDSGISRPFDARRDGFVIGEGAVVLLLEDWDHACGRGATILAELAEEMADAADGYHLTAPRRTGCAVACMSWRLPTPGSNRDVAHVTPTGPRPRSTTGSRPKRSPRSSGPPGLPSPPIKGVTRHLRRGRSHRGRLGRAHHRAPADPADRRLRGLRPGSPSTSSTAAPVGLGAGTDRLQLVRLRRPRRCLVILPPNEGLPAGSELRSGAVQAARRRPD